MTDHTQNLLRDETESPLESCTKLRNFGALHGAINDL